MGSKFSVLTLASLATFAASHAYADAIAIKPKLTHSQIRAESDGYGLSPQQGRDADDTVAGLGFGVDFEFQLDDRARFGSEVSMTNYEQNEAESSDMALAGYFAYDFISQSNMIVYGKGGLSLHQFALEDFNSASLLNGDVGVGLALAVAPSMDFGGEYRYSTTLGRDDMSQDSANGIRLDDVAIERNDLSVFVSFKF
ncbi:outer membrane protein [Oligoflexus tunisiensis]|uniref:outer membrane protein n=1 Tax=Oligoflexus tunisiensis TaxID=708132 RepID=UPI00114CA6A7|nr:outer membrane beta-barrel protein [Oligoflexus tunisiensis]